jgi:hypothetical protein
MRSSTFGKDIIGATVLFLAGYLAGQGAEENLATNSSYIPPYIHAR